MKGYDAWLAREPEETCIHAGIECEYNTGGDACPCDCVDCESPDVEDSE